MVEKALNLGHQTSLAVRRRLLSISRFLNFLLRILLWSFMLSSSPLASRGAQHYSGILFDGVESSGADEIRLRLRLSFLVIYRGVM